VVSDFFLIPISFFCKSAYGLDHKNFILKIKLFFKFFSKKNLLSGNFLKKQITIKFDKILIYSVLQYLSNEKELQDFVFKSITLLNKNGKVLLGDIPIAEYEHKYYNSLEGKRFKNFFLLSNSRSIQKGKKFSISDYLIYKKKDKKLVRINLNIIKKLVKKIKQKNYIVKVFKHNKKNIFGNSRIDILISKK
jgi:cyclopropane fatty-acyl-phospholipid synthase-like methyltransferase